MNIRTHFTSASFMALMLIILPWDAAHAKPPAGSSQNASSSQGAQSSASPQAAQPPPIPLELHMAARCERQSRTPIATNYTAECKLGTTAAAVLSAWTETDNCQLSLAYNNSDWKTSQDIILNFLRDLTCHEPPVTGSTAKLLCSPAGAIRASSSDCATWFATDGYASIVFVDDALHGPVLSRILVHSPAPEVYGNRVGAYKLYDLQLLTDFGISIATVYQATTTPNSFITQIPGVFTQVAGAAKIFGPASSSGVGAGNSGQMVTQSHLILNDAQALSDRLNSVASILTTSDSVGNQQAAGKLQAAAGELKKLGKNPATDATFSALADVLSIAAPPEKTAPQILQDLAKQIGDVSHALHEAQQLLVRSVEVPGALQNKHLVPTVAAIPQVSVTDQLAFTPSLETGYLESVSARAARDDGSFPNRRCDWGLKSCDSSVVPSCLNCGPVATVNKQLSDRYDKCRFAALGLQFFVFQSDPSKPLGTVGATLSDASGQLLGVGPLSVEVG